VRAALTIADTDGTGSYSPPGDVCTGVVGAEKALEVVQSATEVARPDAIAAYAVASDKSQEAKKRLAGLPDSLLAGWIFDLA
jgi:hypothetical protein